ncbi:MAG TPA: N-acyl homoserine lactonase family protein [Streptosporangiaceae bacterium]|jgi:glyoxylase-like metal-dependent hydrolase (beta-lactamase superfamily II)|nr:N-acyl homoserine lactonase family protein [Streptosporangiaceae bacterium]
MIEPSDIGRIHLGHYTMPPESRLAGQKVVVCAYLVRYPGGVLLFDTGIGTGHAAAEEEFGPMVRRPLPAELAHLGLTVTDVSAVANCHLHLDHCGGNPQFPRTPLFVQRQELDALPTLDYVLPGMIDFDGATLEIHDGRADVAPGLRLIPTPGHTPGHQSLLVDTTRGRILLAGQAMDGASDYGRAQFGLDVAAAAQEPQPTGPPWLNDLQALDIRLVLFAHDVLTWTPAQAAATHDWPA